MAADFTLKAHDRLPSIQATFSTGSTSLSVDLTDASAVTFIMAPKSGGAPVIDSAATVDDAVNGLVSYDWQVGDTATPGEYQAEWQVTWADGRKQTFPTLNYHSITILADLDNA